MKGILKAIKKGAVKGVEAATTVTIFIISLSLISDVINGK